MKRYAGFERWLPPSSSRSVKKMSDTVDPAVAAQWLHALYQSPVLFSGLLDVAGRVVAANHLSVEGCSLVRSTVIGTPFWEGGWWSPDPALAGKIREWCEKAAATGQSLSAVCPYFRGDGSSGMVELGLVPIIDHDIDGQPVSYMVATGLDISELLSAQAAREDRLTEETTTSQTRQRWLNDALNAMLDGVIIARSIRDDLGEIVDFTVEFANQASLDTTGRTAEAVIGRRVCDIYPSWRTSGMFDVYVNVVETGHPYIGERIPYDDVRDDGTVIRGYWDMRISKLDDGYISASRDVTAAVRDEQAVRDANATAGRERLAMEILQQAALNIAVPTVPGVSIGVHYQPAMSDVPIGGDWYDVIALDDNQRVVLIIADVAGHGPESAGFMVQVRNTLRTLATLLTDPDDVLREANRVILALHGPEVPFITCCVAVLDTPTGALRWALAGHPPMLARSNDGTSVYLWSKAGPPLTVDTDADYQPGETMLTSGDRIVMYTDGLVETRRTPLDEGMDRLITCTAACHHKPSGAAAEWLATTVSSGDDDVAVIVVDLA